MARLSLSKRQALRKKNIMTLFMHWLNVMSIVQRFCELLEKITMHEIQSNSLRRHLYVLDIATNRQIVHELVYESDATCVVQLRVNRLAFTNLCTMLESRGGLRASKYLQIDEQVAMFLHIISHHVKNSIIKFQFLRLGETVCKYFHNVLHSVIRLHGELLKKPELVPENSIDERWKWFMGCLGALDGTYVRVRVPVSEKPKYQNRKGDIATNVFGVCSQDMQFIYILPGWEGSAANGRVLSDALRRTTGLRVPHDVGYSNCNRFLSPFCGQRYHLSEWRNGQQPNSAPEFFNMKHSSARNVIERCFGVLKNRWAILRGPAFYPIKTQNQIIMACCLLYNFIRREMLDDEADLTLDESDDEDNEVNESITSIEPSNKWSAWRLTLAQHMFNEWRQRRVEI
ncbi:hypothetical protein UlMin_004659 [Ulmus minor]